MELKQRNKIVILCYKSYNFYKIIELFQLYYRSFLKKTGQVEGIC